MLRVRVQYLASLGKDYENYLFCFVLNSCSSLGFSLCPMLVNSSVSGIENLSLAIVKVKAIVELGTQSRASI